MKTLGKAKLGYSIPMPFGGGGRGGGGGWSGRYSMCFSAVAFRLRVLYSATSYMQSDYLIYRFWLSKKVSGKAVRKFA